MVWSIYADISREFTRDERSLIFFVLDQVVPSSGCVGLQKGVEEVYFQVEAGSEADALADATRVMETLLRITGLAFGFKLEMQRSS